MSWSVAWSVASSATAAIPCVHRPKHSNLPLTNYPKRSANDRRLPDRRVPRTLAERLTDRDWLVLERCGDLRFVTGSQLARLCFSDSNDPKANARAARRALLRLVRLGVLERLPRPVGGVRAGSAGFVYRLGLGGHRLAVLRGWQPERQRRRSQVPGTLFVRHTLQIAELHTRLIEGERSGRVELLELDGEPSCHRRYDGLGGQRSAQAGQLRPAGARRV